MIGGRNLLTSFYNWLKQGPTLQQAAVITVADNTGLTDMPLMGFGTFIGIEADRIANARIRKKTTTDSIYNALAMGYRHLDLAENYNNLDSVADALKKAFKPKSRGGLGLKREDIWLTMKADVPFTQDHINALLKSVGVEYFDLFLIHHPNVGTMFESERDLEQNWRDLASIDKKQLKHIGVSNFYEPHLTRLLAICEQESLVKPYANEVELNILSKNQSLIDYCKTHHIKVIACSPLGYNFGAVLFGNTNLKNLATKIRAKPAQAALAWIMAKDIAVIPKSTQKKHLEDNYKSKNFIAAVKKNPRLNAAIDSEPDLIDDGLTTTTADSKAHGQSLSWDVSVKEISTFRIC